MVAVLAPEGVGPAGDALLSIAGLSKSLGGPQAVRDVTFDAAAGEVLARLGRNGAGKSTGIEMLAGIHGVDAGDVRLDGAVHDPCSTTGGVAFIHQDLEPGAPRPRHRRQPTRGRVERRPDAALRHRSMRGLGTARCHRGTRVGGATTLRPGRVNLRGTVVGVGILAMGIFGIPQFGGEAYVGPLFDGATLPAAIGIAGFSQRRRRLWPTPSQPPGIGSA